MEQNKKKNRGIKIVLLVLVFIIVGLLIYLIVDRINNKPSDTVIKNTTEIKKINEDEEYVYDNPKYVDKTVPYVNIDSDDAKSINNKIEKYVDGKASDTWNELFYYYYINDNIISILFGNKLGDTFNSKYRIYNINVKTGKIVSNKELIDIKKTNREEIASSLNETIEKSYGDSIEFAKETTIRYDGEIDLTVYEANKTSVEGLKVENMKLYLNEKKELCIVFDTFTIAGSMTSEYLYNLDTKNVIKLSM